MHAIAFSQASIVDGILRDYAACVSAERAAAETKAYGEYAKLPLGAKPPSPEAIARARQQYWGHQ